MSLAVGSGQPTKEFLSEKIPVDELWTTILNHLATDPKLCHITAMAFVSKKFLELCLTSFRMHLAFGSIASIDRNSLERIKIESCLFLGVLQDQLSLLTIDEQGRHYSRSLNSNKEYILYIMDPTLMKVTILDLKATFPESLDIAREPLPMDVRAFWNAQEIVHCYPTEKGFIVVTISGCSIWEWDEKGEPLFCSFISPFKAFKHTKIINSAFYQGKVLIQQGDMFKDTIQVLDLNDVKPRFCDVEITETIKQVVSVDRFPNSFSQAGFFHQVEGELCFLYNSKNSKVICLTLALNRSEKGFVLEQKAEPTSFGGTLWRHMLPIGSQNWSLYFLHDPEQMFVVRNGTIWMGSEFSLVMPSIQKNEYCSIYQDFLFLKYQDKPFRLIYLPTKQECSFNSQSLEEYLVQKKLTFYCFAIEYSSKGYLVLKFLVRTEDRCLHALKIPVYLENLQPIIEDLNVPDLPLDPCVEEVPQPSLQELPRTIKIQKDAPSCCSHKMTFWVGIALFILTSGASIALIVLHPGTVVYEGNGVILTLPAVLTLSLGGSAALITIAIGSYLWWKEKSTF